MSDLEVSEPQLFAIFKKAKGKRAKKYRRPVLPRNRQSTFKVKKLKLRIQQAGPPIPQQEDHFFPEGTSLHPSMLHCSSSLNQPVTMFRVNIPAYGYTIKPSQNPRGQVVYEEPIYTNSFQYPLVNRTHEAVWKNTVPPMWGERHLEDERQSGEPIEASGSEMLSYLRVDDEDLEMDTNEDSTGS
jgi:hypothetical protein